MPRLLLRFSGGDSIGASFPCTMHTLSQEEGVYAGCAAPVVDDVCSLKFRGLFLFTRYPQTASNLLADLSEREWVM